VHAQPTDDGLRPTTQFDVRVAAIEKDPYFLFTSAGEAQARRLWDRLQRECVTLGTIAHVNFGKQLRDRAKYPRDVIRVRSAKKVRAPYRACYTGRNVGRYRLAWEGLACLDDEVARSGGCWDPDRQNATNKVLTRQIGKYPEYAIDTAGCQCLNTVFMVTAKSTTVQPLYLLGVLNSRLLRACWLQRFYDQRRTFPKIKGTYLKELPIAAPEAGDKQGQARRDRMVQLVEGMLGLQRQLAVASSEHQKTLLGRQIEATDRQIDRLVYELYGLTDEEVQLVEEATSGRSDT
jgi:hypothetical protein